MYVTLCLCALPVRFEVLEASLQVIQQVDLFATLRTVDIHEVSSVMVSHFTRCLARAVKTHADINTRTLAVSTVTTTTFLYFTVTNPLLT